MSDHAMTQDLTKITTPFSLLDTATQEALKAHGGPYQYVNYKGKWREIEDGPSWAPDATYRVKPQPRCNECGKVKMPDIIEQAEDAQGDRLVSGAFKDGAAFPYVLHEGHQYVDAGMTLRDWFAGQALAGILSQPDAHMFPRTKADDAYDVADAMLAARSGAIWEQDT
jgi:hypothetical protein